MEEVNLKNKRILYIAPVWFHYDQFILSKLIELGSIVDSYNIDLTSVYYKVIDKLKQNKAKDVYKFNYYNKIFKTGGYDYVLVRQGYQITSEFIDKLRIVNPNARFINFHWDSIRSQFNYLPIINSFDKVYSFDSRDCLNYSKIEYLPLFYLDEYDVNNVNCYEDKEIDVLFVGAWRDKERYDLIKLTEEICNRNNLNFYYYLRSCIEDQIYYFKDHKTFQKGAQAKMISHAEILKLFSISKVVIDFPSSFQTGLTIRCFETLASGLKLITTNVNILTEPFYDPEFISIIDVNNLRLDVEFIKNATKSSMKDALKNYSIGNYINKLLK